jgi:lipoate-protein ligase A
VNAELFAEQKSWFPFKTLRLIPFHFHTGRDNMCLDYYLAQDVVPGREPVIRFYGWNPFCLSLGKHQKSTDVNTEALQQKNYDLVRRPTGGSAILHSEEWTYSFIVPGENLNHKGLYQLFHRHLEAALQKLGYPVSLENKASGYRLNQGGETFACFNRSAYSEVQSYGRKVVGSAQKILPRSLLQHGSVLTGKAHLGIVHFLNTSEEEKRLYSDVLKERSVSLYFRIG